MLVHNLQFKWRNHECLFKIPFVLQTWLEADSVLLWKSIIQVYFVVDAIPFLFHFYYYSKYFYIILLAVSTTKCTVCLINALFKH